MSENKDYKTIEDEIKFEKELNSDINQKLLEDYKLILIFDPKKGGDKVVRYSPRLLVKPDEWNPIKVYEQHILYICENHVFPADRELFRKETSPLRIINHLNNSDNYYFSYRVIDETDKISKWQVRFKYLDPGHTYIIAAFYSIAENSDSIEPFLQTNALLAKQFACVGLINMPRKELSILNTSASFREILGKTFTEEQLNNEEYLYKYLIKKLVIPDDEKFFDNYGNDLFFTHQLKNNVSYQFKIHLKTSDTNNLFRIKFEHLNQNPTYVALTILPLENYQLNKEN